MGFDPNKPYEVVDAPRFDPSQPFETVNDEPAVAALQSSDFQDFSELGGAPQPNAGSGFFKSLVRGVNVGAGNILKGAGQATAPDFEFPIPDDATPAERASIESENERNRANNRMAAAQRNPLVIAGKFISETGEEIPSPTSPLGKVGEIAGNLVPVIATGPYAPIAMASSKYGETFDKQYSELKKRGLTDEQAAEQATATAKNAGLTEGAIWAALPGPLRAFLGKATGLVGEGAVQQFLARRVASSAENAALAAASQAGGNLATGQPVAQGTGQAALGGAALGAVVPFHAPEKPGLDPAIEAAAIAGGRPIVQDISGERLPQQPEVSSAESSQPLVAPVSTAVASAPPGAATNDKLTPEQIAQSKANSSRAAFEALAKASGSPLPVEEPKIVDQPVNKPVEVPEPWQMTRSEYQATEPKSDGVRETLSADLGHSKVDVIKNPSPEDYQRIKEKHDRDFPNDNSGDPKTRFTVDSKGNRYIWAAGDAAHSAIEGWLESKGITANQNTQFLSHRYHVARAILARKPVPNNILAEYPDLKPAEPIVDQTVNKPEVATEERPLQGMGGAVPSEFENSPQTPTGIKNATVERERALRGLPSAVEPARKDFGTVWDRALARIDSDPSWLDGDRSNEGLIAELNRKPRALTDEEDAALLHRQIDLQNEYGKTTRELAKAHDSGQLEYASGLRIRAAELRDKLFDLYEINKRTGTETGRGLNARKMMANEDFTLANMEVEARAANGGKPLDDARLKEVQDFQKKIAEADERIKKAEADATQARAESELNRIKAEASKGPQINPKVWDYAEKIVQGFEKRGDAALIRLRSKLQQVGSAPDPTIIFDLAEWGVGKLGRKALDLAQWSAEAISAFGPAIQPHLEEGYKAAMALLEKDLGKAPKVVKERIKQNRDITAKRESTVSDIKDKIDGGKKGDITNLVQKLARQFVEFGIKDRNELIDAVHGVLEGIDPTITRREAMDAISGYGDFKQLTKDEISVQLRDLKGQMQQVGKLEDMQSGKAPAKTGVERREPSDEERRLIQQVNEAKKKGGFSVTDPAKQLKSALDSIKTRLRNSIADLEHQIASGKRIVKDRTAPPTDAETDALRKQRDTLKEEFDNIFGKKELTDEQRIKAATAALERSVKEYERRIAANDLFPAKKPSKTPNTPELEAMRSKRNVLRAHIDELKSLDEHFQQAKEDARLKSQQEAAARQVAELERRLEEGDLASRSQNQNRPAPPELEMFRQRRDELNRQIAEARKTPDGQKRAEAILRQKETLEKQIAELESKISRGDISTKNAPVNRPADPELEPLRQKRDELNRQLAEMRKKPDAQKAVEAARRQLDALNKQIAEREAKLKIGDLSSKPQKQNRPLSSPELEAAKQRLEAVNKQIEDARKAARPKSTPEERANKAFKTRTLNRIDELQQRMANEDFSKKPRVPVQLNPENQKLQANKAEVVEAYRKSLLRDQLKNRTTSQKVLDTLVKWRRGFLLSSPITLAKLTSAAAQRMMFTPVEEAAGKVIGTAFPKLAQKAIREGGFSIRAESKAITEGFTKGISDAWQTLRTGKSDLDRLHGRDDALPNSVVDFFGHLHGALKATTKRAEFARSFEKRIEAAGRTGVDVTDPLVQTRIALDAYKDAQKAIFQQDNRVVSAYKAALRRLENPDKVTGKVPAASKAAAFAAKVFLPIVKVPTNIVAETMEYAVGSVTGSVNLAKAYRAGIDNLPPEQADLIMRQLKKGSLGAGLLLLGFFNPQVIGGYYQAGEKRKDSDVKAGNVNLYGHNIPSYLLHNPLLETLQIGATVRRVADSKLKQSDKDPQGISAGVMAGALGLVEEVPFFREMMEVTKAFDPHSRGAFAGELLKSTAVPQALQFVAQHYDTDANGEQVKRKPATILQHIETGIPGLRETVPAKK